MRSKHKKLRSFRRSDPLFLMFIPPLAALFIKLLMLSCRVIKVKGEEKIWGADRCWILNSWDRYLIPKPFARVVICYTEPLGSLVQQMGMNWRTIVVNLKIA